MKTFQLSLQCSFVPIFLLFCAVSHGEDWPSWRGPNHSGVSSESLPDISKLTTLWEKQIGPGYAGVAVKDGKAYTMGHNGQAKRGGQETIYCFDAASGETIWSQSYSAILLPAMHEGGPNTTPLIQNEKLYTVSKDGQVQCRNLNDGELLWQSNLMDMLKFKFPTNPVTLPNWGFASAPQIADGKLIVSCGITIALNPEDGKTIWISDKREKSAYGTPTVFKVKNKAYAAVMTGDGVNIINMVDGKTLDHYPMSAKFNMLAATPILIPDAEGELFVSTSNFSARLYFNGAKITARWRSKEIKNKFITSLLIDNHLYGIDGGQGSRRAKIVCVNVFTGQLKWQKEYTGHGTLLGANDGMLFLSDIGELMSFDLSHKGFKERAKRQIIEKICWTAPTLSNGKLYIRNDQGRLICLEESQ